MWILLYHFHRIYDCWENLDYTNLFSPNDYKKNDKVIYKCFTDMAKENVSLDFRLKKLDETKLFFR